MTCRRKLLELFVGLPEVTASQLWAFYFSQHGDVTPKSVIMGHLSEFVRTGKIVERSKDGVGYYSLGPRALTRGPDTETVFQHATVAEVERYYPIAGERLTEVINVSSARRYFEHSPSAEMYDIGGSRFAFVLWAKMPLRYERIIVEISARPALLPAHSD